MNDEANSKFFTPRVVLSFFVGVAVAFALAYVCYKADVLFVGDCPDDGVIVPPDTAVSACIPVTIDHANAMTAITEFGTKYPNPDDNPLGLYGGRICKESLRQIVDIMDGDGREWVNFRLGYRSPGTGVVGDKDTVFMMMSPGSLKPETLGKVAGSDMIIRNGFEMESFCPSMCD